MKSLVLVKPPCFFLYLVFAAISSTCAVKIFSSMSFVLSMIFSPWVKLTVGWSRPDRVAQGERFLKVIF